MGSATPSRMKRTLASVCYVLLFLMSPFAGGSTALTPPGTVICARLLVPSHPMRALPEAEQPILKNLVESMSTEAETALLKLLKENEKPVFSEHTFQMSSQTLQTADKKNLMQFRHQLLVLDRILNQERKPGEIRYIGEVRGALEIQRHMRSLIEDIKLLNQEVRTLLLAANSKFDTDNLIFGSKRMDNSAQRAAVLNGLFMALGTTGLLAESSALLMGVDHPLLTHLISIGAFGVLTVQSFFEDRSSSSYPLNGFLPGPIGRDARVQRANQQPLLRPTTFWSALEDWASPNFEEILLSPTQEDQWVLLTLDQWISDSYAENLKLFSQGTSREFVAKGTALATHSLFDRDEEFLNSKSSAKVAFLLERPAQGEPSLFVIQSVGTPSFRSTLTRKKRAEDKAEKEVWDPLLSPGLRPVPVRIR